MRVLLAPRRRFVPAGRVQWDVRASGDTNSGTIRVLATDGVLGPPGTGSATTPGITSTAGSTIIVVAATFANLGLVSGDLTDSKGNSYTLLSSLGGGVSSVGLGIWINAGGTRGATHTITLNAAASGGDTFNLAVLEVATTGLTYQAANTASATDATNPFDVTAGAAIPRDNITIAATVLSDSGAANTWSMASGYSDIASFGNGLSGLISTAQYRLGETGTPTISMPYTGVPINTGLEAIWVLSEQAPAGAADPDVPLLHPPSNLNVYRM